MVKFYKCTLWRCLNLKSASFFMLALSVLVLQAGFSAKAQQTASQKIQITGTVKDKEEGALPGVSISVKGTKIATSSDGEGKFSLTVPNDQAILVFELIGFQRKEIPIAGKRIINTTLETSISNLDEVVVIGYGSVAKRDLVGSVGSANVADMNKAPVRSFEEALAGRIAGVQVTSVDGQPGSNINIVIRGANSITGTNAPLYVIDGFPIENPNNNNINPSDIESIETLKDAAATAIYGARGSNGVIIITTKSGKEGTAVIAYDGSYGAQKVIQRMEVFDAYEFVRYSFERIPDDAPLLYLNPERPTLESYRNVEAVNWQDRMFRSAAQQNHSLSINGGTKGTKYAFSGNYLDQQGVLVTSGYQRYQGRMRLTQRITDKFMLAGNINYSRNKQFGSSPIPGSGSVMTEALMYSVWGYRPVNGNPGVDVGEEDLDLTIDIVNDKRFNPLKNYENMLRDRLGSSLSVNAYGEYTLNDFKFRVSGSITRDMTRANSFDGSSTRAGSPLTTQGQATGVSGTVSFSEVNNYVNSNQVTYDKKFGKYHQVNAIGVFEVSGRSASGFGATANFIPNEALGVYGLDEGVPNSISSNGTDNTLVSLLSRIQYNYGSKYLATISMRADASSKFSKGNKTAYFPSGGIAWRFSKEKFMKSLKFVSDAKLRATLGATGNNRVSDFAYLSTLFQSIAGIYPFNNSITRGVIATDLGNDKLKWETTVQADLGLELSFFNDRVNLNVDVYKKTTKDLLLNATLPPSLGFDRSYKNIGRVGNKGLEFTLATSNIRNKTFSWTSNFNIAFNRNKVLALTQNQSSLVSQINWDGTYKNLSPYIAKIGDPIGMFYGLIWEGNYQYPDFDKLPSGQYLLKPEITSNGDAREKIQPGDIKYRDLNGDGITNGGDYTVIGNPNPDFIGGFSNNFTYKGFDLNIFLQWSYGNEVLNANRIAFEGFGRASQNMFATYANRWTPENQNNTYYRTFGYGPPNYSSRVIEDASFLRLKTVALGYQLPGKLMKSVGMKSLRLNVSAQNLYTWTKYQGYDPEVSAYNSALTPGFDWSVYPRARTITFGANLTF
jgi:TonB-linked SusC/RagA family outer membrane protein